MLAYLLEGSNAVLLILWQPSVGSSQVPSPPDLLSTRAAPRPRDLRSPDMIDLARRCEALLAEEVSKAFKEQELL